MRANISNVKKLEEIQQEMEKDYDNLREKFDEKSKMLEEIQSKDTQDNEKN